MTDYEPTPALRPTAHQAILAGQSPAIPGQAGKSDLRHEPTCAYYGLTFKPGSGNRICPCPGRPAPTSEQP